MKAWDFFALRSHTRTDRSADPDRENYTRKSSKNHTKNEIDTK